MIARATKTGRQRWLAWAAEVGHPSAGKAFGRLEKMWRNDGQYIVTSAWTLSAAIAARNFFDTRQLMQSSRAALLRVLRPATGIFRMNLRVAPGSSAHVGCFADQVYPIQALARYHKAFGDDQCLAAANRCAAQICRLQAQRQAVVASALRKCSGKVLEGYPVYSVHQHAMRLAALLDLFDAGGDDHAEPTRRGLRWMQNAPEVNRSLIEEDMDLIWRKVARAEPRKLTRKVRAGVSRILPPCRLSAMNLLFRPTRIDFECRPYEFGWMLNAWLGGLK